MAFNMFPYSNLHELNLDWVLRKTAEAVQTCQEALTAINALMGNAVLYTSQERDAGERRTACGNIHALSYDAQGLHAADRTVARANIQTVAYEEQSLTDSQKQQARSNIGAVSASDLPDLSDVVKVTEQSFTPAQKQQARSNIGAVSASDLPDLSDVVKVTEQSFTPAQKQQARSNIGAAASADIPNVSDVVRTSAQTFSTAQKTQARTNIGAAASADIPNVSDVVRTSTQTFTDAQKAQARTNIGASSPLVFTIEAASGSSPWSIPSDNYASLSAFLSAIASGNPATLQVSQSVFQNYPQVFKTSNLAVYGNFIAATYCYDISTDEPDAASELFTLTISIDTAHHTWNAKEHRELPNTTASDNGKTVKVGQWGAIVLEDMRPLVLEFATENPYTVTTPLADIKAAIDAGRQVMFKLPGLNGTTTLKDYGPSNTGVFNYILFNTSLFNSYAWYNGRSDVWEYVVNT